MRRALLLIATTVVALGISMTTTAAGTTTATAPSTATMTSHPRLPGGFKHLVVIYMENHSFDNLYGGWGSINGQDVEGLDDAPAAGTTQVAQDGSAFTCLLQNDPNLSSPPLPGDCSDSHQVTGAATPGFKSHFPNQPFSIDDYLAPEDTTCPKPGQSLSVGIPKGSGDPGGCTRDLVHRFYQEQYALNGGQQNRYVTGSDAIGLSMGHYETKNLPIYRYLHTKGAPRYVIADHFFQAAFGGSFLNHQWLISARTPYDDPDRSVPAGRLRARPSAVDAAGMPTGLKYPLYDGSGDPGDFEKTVPCDPDPTASVYARACGSWAVNTVQPSSPPNNPNGRFIPLIEDGDYPNIGDRLSDAGISWNWYTGHWDEITSDPPKPAPLFQFHHQPFEYFADYAPGKPGRSHLRDEDEFIAAARNGTLPTVSFVKPYGSENEHPGYASEPLGSDHLVSLLRDVTEGDQAGNTLVVVTYDEFGGQWDHVPPPAGPAVGAAADRWGPGSRIPAMIVGRSLTRSGVDHTSYDTTSILATIERSFGLAPLSTRDAAVNDLTNAVHVGGR
jgi:acid phosphatase